MAKITMIQRDFVTSTADTSNISRYAQAGETIGKGIEQYQAQQDKIKKASIDMEVAKKNSELNLRLNNSFNQTKNKYQSDPLGGEQAFNTDIDMVIDDVSKDMNEQSKNAFKAQTYKYADTYKMKANNWSATQNTANIATNFDDTKKTYQEQFYLAGKSLDQDSFATAMASYTNNLNLYSSAIEPSKLKELNETSKSDFVKSYLNAGARDLPTETLEVIKSGQFDKYLTQEDKDGLIDSTGMRILQNKNVENRIKTEMPFEHMASQGMPAPEINVDNPMQTANSITDREMYIDTARKQGVEIDFLKDEEVEDFYKAFQTENPNEFLNVARRIDINSSATANNEIAAQLSKKDPIMGSAFAFSSVDKNLSRSILNGNKILKEKTLSTMPADKKVTALFNSTYGNTIKNTTVTSQMIETAKAVYADRLYNSGGEFNEGDLKNVFKEIVGDTAKINGSTTITFRDLYKNVVTGDQLEDNFKTLTDNDFKNTLQEKPYIGDEEVELSHVKDYAILAPIADGKYNLLLKTNNSFLTTKDGDPYTLDMKTIYQRRQSEGNLASVGFLSNLLLSDETLTENQKILNRANELSDTPEYRYLSKIQQAIKAKKEMKKAGEI